MYLKNIFLECRSYNLYKSIFFENDTDVNIEFQRRYFFHFKDENL